MNATQTRSTRLAPRLLAVAIAALLAAPGWADVSVAGDVSARLGTLSRGGDWKADYDNSDSSVDGNFALFFTATKDLKNGYNAGFNCNTVATTVSGANAGFTAEALPVSHAWDGYFAGKDNYPSNGHGGGFSSYGDVNGDNKGPMCNDEVFGTLSTPYGRFQVGNIMNPMRLLYDLTTVDPVWGDQRGYYSLADIRGNALRYGNSFGNFGVELQFQTASNATRPGSDKGKGRALTGVVTYEFENGSLIGAGILKSDGGFRDKYVDKTADGATNTAYGFTGKTRLGKVNLAYTFMTGTNKPDNYTFNGKDYFFKSTDHTFKATYDIGAWSLQGYASFEKTVFNNPGDYKVEMGALQGTVFHGLDIKRTNIDLWALYNLGNGATPYLRINTISKNFTSPTLAGLDADIRSTKFEGGWLMHF